MHWEPSFLSRRWESGSHPYGLFSGGAESAIDPMSEVALCTRRIRFAVGGLFVAVRFHVAAARDQRSIYRTDEQNQSMTCYRKGASGAQIDRIDTAGAIDGSDAGAAFARDR